MTLTTVLFKLLRWVPTREDFSGIISQGVCQDQDLLRQDQGAILLSRYNTRDRENCESTIDQEQGDFFGVIAIAS
jgi:hypothetical protein